MAKAALRVVTVDEKYGPRLYLTMPEVQDQMLCLEQSTPNFGGVRWWFKCECGDRCSKLYLPLGETQFRCRKALNLTYESQHLSPVWRLQRRAQKLRDRLDAAEKSVEFPNKPKGMWFRTYQRLYRQMATAEGKSLAAMQGWAALNVGRQ